MDVIRDLADITIRRACAFAGLGVGVVMLALSFDLALACRAGAALTAVLCLGLAVAGWCAPRRDMRRTELWSMLVAVEGGFTRRVSRAEAQEVLAGVLQQRLLWHAERVGAIALALWGVVLVAMLVQLARYD